MRMWLPIHVQANRGNIHQIIPTETRRNLHKAKNIYLLLRFASFVLEIKLHKTREPTVLRMFVKFRILSEGDFFNRIFSTSTCFNKLLIFLSNVLTRML